MLINIFDRLELCEEKNVLVQGIPSTLEKFFTKLSFAKNLTPLLKSRKIDFALVFALNYINSPRFSKMLFLPCVQKENCGLPILNQLLKL